MNAVMTEIKIPAGLANLYALTDAERFPASLLAEGLERESTLFWADFSVADRFGIKAIKETFDNCHFENRGYKTVTELAVVLNHKMWEWNGKIEKAEADNMPYHVQFCKVVLEMYGDYYNKVVAWVDANYSGKEADFFWRIMD